MHINIGRAKGVCMKQLFGKIMLGIGIAFLVISCSSGGNSGGGDEYQVLAYHSLDTFGSETQVEIYMDGMTAVSGADVTINGVTVPEQSLFGYAYYYGTDLISANPGDEVILVIELNGNEILNKGITIPGDYPSLTSYPDPWNVTNAQTVQWSNVSGVDKQEFYISFGNTQSGDDYNPTLDVAATNHLVPANTVEYDADFNFFTFEVRAVNEDILDNFASGSYFRAYTYEWAMPDTTQ